MNSKETGFVRTTQERAQLVGSLFYSRTWSVITVKTTDRTDTGVCEENPEVKPHTLLNSDRNRAQVEEGCHEHNFTKKHTHLRPTPDNALEPVTRSASGATVFSNQWG